MQLTIRRAIALAVFGTVACATGPEPPQAAGTYSRDFAPPQVIHATATCDRLLTYAVLSMNRLGDFDLSINITNDCTPAGAGYSYGEVLILGKYARAGTSLQFTPNPGNTGPFSGSLSADTAYVTLPARPDSLAATSLDLQLPRRAP